MKQDPVCLMAVKENEAVTTECDGVVYYFCSEGCRDKFLKDRTCPRTAYDLVIVGGGPAGLTAAVYAATLKIEALIITQNLGGQAVNSTKIENYMGFDFITGPELIDKFKAQLFHSHNLDHLISEVEKIEPRNGEFQITTAELKNYSAKVLLIATGMTRRKLNIHGEKEFLRKGIFYGNIQELGLVENETAAVIGGGNSDLQVVENLGSITKEVYLVSTSELSADKAIIDRVT